MKNLLFIALMFSFLIGNAQQDRQQFGPNSAREPVQLYTDDNPGYPSEIDLNRYSIRKTYHVGLPIDFDVNRYTIRKTDNLDPSHPSQVDVNRYTIRKTDNLDPSHPSQVDVNRYTIRKPY